MGWTFINRFSKRSDFKEFIKDRTKTDNAVNYSNDISSSEKIGTFTCLKHCVRGNILWTVWEVSYLPNHIPEVLVEAKTSSRRFIGCDMLQFSNGWGYKDMDESVGPCYYTCPKSYLAMVPVDNQEWRDSVMAYHNKFDNVKVTDVILLTNGQKAVITSKKPFLGRIDGRTYRIPRRMISKNN